MKSNIIKSLSALLVLLHAFTANNYSQSANTNKPTKKVLIVLSAADTWTRANGEKYPTGYWAEEFVDVHK